MKIPDLSKCETVADIEKLAFEEAKKEMGVKKSNS